MPNALTYPKRTSALSYEKRVGTAATTPLLDETGAAILDETGAVIYDESSLMTDTGLTYSKRTSALSFDARQT